MQVKRRAQRVRLNLGLGPVPRYGLEGGSIEGREPQLVLRGVRLRPKEECSGVGREELVDDARDRIRCAMPEIDGGKRARGGNKLTLGVAVASEHERAPFLFVGPLEALGREVLTIGTLDADV